MRVKSRQELTRLAELMVKEFVVENIIGTSDFLIYAQDIIEDENLDINIQTVEKWKDWVENKIKDIQVSEEPDEITKFINEMDKPKKELKTTIHLYSDGTFEIVKHKKEEVVDLSKVPNYTMFIESEDGYLVTRGAYKGKYVSDIDKDSWVGCAAGWANKILIDNERLGSTRPGALTDDDKVVLEKVKINKI